MERDKEMKASKQSVKKNNNLFILISSRSATYLIPWVLSLHSWGRYSGGLAVVFTPKCVLNDQQEVWHSLTTTTSFTHTHTPPTSMEFFGATWSTAHIPHFTQILCVFHPYFPLSMFYLLHYIFLLIFHALENGIIKNIYKNSYFVEVNNEPPITIKKHSTVKKCQFTTLSHH